MTVRITTTSIITPYSRVLTDLDDALDHLVRIGYLMPDHTIVPGTTAAFGTDVIGLEEGERHHSIECDTIDEHEEYTSDADLWFDELDVHLSTQMQAYLKGM